MSHNLLQSRGKNVHSDVQNKGNIAQYVTQNKGKMTNREILLEMYEKLWNAEKDKWAWYTIVKDSLEKLEANKRCKHIKIEGESCRLNNNCTYPDCK